MEDGYARPIYRSESNCAASGMRNARCFARRNPSFVSTNFDATVTA